MDWPTSRLGRSSTVARLLVLAALVAYPAAVASPAAAHDPLGNLQSVCTREILETPEVASAEVTHAGKPNQRIFIVLNFKGVSSKCNRHFERLADIRIEIRNPRFGSRWWSEDGPGWPDTVYYSRNQCGAGGADSVNSYRKPMMYWTPGSKLRFRLRLRVLEPKSESVVASRINSFPIVHIFRGSTPARLRHQPDATKCPDPTMGQRDS